MQRLTIISVAFPFACVSADPVGGAEQVLASLDRALVAAGHRSIVIAAEGSRVAGDLIAIPTPAQEIGRRERIEAHGFLRSCIPDVARQSGAILIHMHGVDFASYLPPPTASVLATAARARSFRHAAAAPACMAARSSARAASVR